MLKNLDASEPNMVLVGEQNEKLQAIAVYNEIDEVERR